MIVSDRLDRLAAPAGKMDGMALPLFGTSRATVHAASAISIHGDIYYDLSLRLDGGSEAEIARVPQHLLKRPPQGGDRVDLTFLMSQIAEVRFI